jgi:hypothetical protein
MATRVGPARDNADNPAGLTQDAGYTTATDSRVDQLLTVFPFTGGRSPYTGG